MAIKITSDKGVIGAVGGVPFRQEVEILCDTEAEITALGETVEDMNGQKVIPTPGSMAHTAGYGVIYELSPSGLWTKV